MDTFGDYFDLNIIDIEFFTSAAGFTTITSALVIRPIITVGGAICTAVWFFWFIRRVRRIVGTRIENLYGLTIKIRIGKQFSRLFEIHDGEKVFIVFFIDARATANDLFEFSH